eukprot:1555316-Prymnesium_polylepis.1
MEGAAVLSTSGPARTCHAYLAAAGCFERRWSSCLRTRRVPHGASRTTIGSPSARVAHSSARASQPPRAAHSSSESATTCASRWAWPSRTATAVRGRAARGSAGEDGAGLQD